MKKSQIGLIMVLISFVFVLAGLAAWHVRDYEMIDQTRLYETRTNRVLIFQNSQDRLRYQLSATFLGSQLDGAQKLATSVYTGKSDPITYTVELEEASRFEYTFKGEIVEVDGLKYPMTKGSAISYELEVGKRYALILRTTISKTDYQLPSGKKVMVLSGKPYGTYLEMIELPTSESK